MGPDFGDSYKMSDSNEEVSADKRRQSSILADVLLLTEKMLCSAREDAWDAVTKYEEERRDALALCFAAPVPVDQSALFSEALAAMLHMNEEMIGLLEAAKENVAIKRTDQGRAKRSLGHYLDIENSH
jgi:hypothetical protein